MKGISFRQRRYAVVVNVMLLVLATALWVRILNVSGESQHADATDKKAKEVFPDTASTRIMAFNMPAPGRNPFQYANPKKQKIEKSLGNFPGKRIIHMELLGVIRSGDSFQAVLYNEDSTLLVVGEGDRVQFHRILSISERGVRLTTAGNDTFLGVREAENAPAGER